MSFNNVIGQARIKQSLVELVQFNRLSHALLFLGNEGSGALPLALAYAQYVLCAKVNNRTPAPPAGPSLFGEEAPVSQQEEAGSGAFPLDACGVCPSCVKAAKLIHPDIHFS